MAKRDDDLFKRLRAAGLRKEIARPLSDAGADARKKSVRAARAAIGELRALADELERRLPAESATPAAKPAATRTRSAATAAKPATTRAARTRSTTAAPAAKRPARRAAAAKRPARRAPAARRAASAPATGNRAAIVKALGSGPLTATEVANKTGISVSTVSTTLARMVKSGDLVKATRGYGLPT